MSFNVVLTAYETGGFDGISLALTPEVGITGIDLDHCVLIPILRPMGS